MLNKLFEINVYIDACNHVENESESVNMILFHGDCDCSFFKGEILPGGCDTQKFFKNKESSLSARYILQGCDAEGAPTNIFIENNGSWNKDGQIETKPLIITDNKKLAWLEKTDLVGKIADGDKEGHIRIQFFTKD